MLMMSKWKDSSQTPKSSLDEMLMLQKEIQHLQQENKALHIRSQGVQVLGKVLQESQENNVRLQKEVEQLKCQLNKNGIDTTQVDLSVCSTVHDDGQGTVVGNQCDSYHSSITNSNSGICDYVNVTTVSGPQSLSAGFPSLLPGENHIKEIQAEFQLITCELDQLIKDARSLQENVERLPVYNRDAEIKGMLTRLSTNLNEYAKQARARETLSSALVSEEEQIRVKLAVMEEEQASHENVVQELKKKLDESREEIGLIQGKVNLFEEAVHSEKGKKTGVALSQPLLVNSGQNLSLSSSQQSLLREGTLSKSTGLEKCEGCNRLQRQITELQKQLLVAKAEKDEALKRKEEILDVNHKWDAQYKMLAAATSKEIAELKEQVKVLSSTGSPMKNGALIETTGLEKRALEQRCRQLENDLQQKQLEINKLQLILRNQPGDRPPTPQSLSIGQQPSHPSPFGVAVISSEAHAVSPTHSPSSWPGNTPSPQQIPAEVIDQIEVLKQQLRVYADDFATEREDRERNQAEKEKMREELNAVKEQVQALEQQVQIYEEDFKREKREKEILQQQLRSNYSGGGYQYQDPMSQRARAVAEQEARVHAIREVHDRERDRLLREQQELQQHMHGQYQGPYSQYNTYVRGQDYRNQDWKRQNYPLVPRGSFPTRGPVTQTTSQSSANSMYHGGEVMPDRVEDVVDTLADGNDAENGDSDDKTDEVVQLEECPRCLRKFQDENGDAILKHIERCIS